MPDARAESPVLGPEDLLRRARETFEIEASALRSVGSRIGDAFVHAVQCILRSPGRVVVMGLGKSGLVGRKMAATLASTGTPALFVHLGEALHGDLGMVQAEDVVVVLSNSGESDEIVVVLPALKRLAATVVAMTGGLESTLARHADLVLDCGVEKEACPLNLAPTASSTAMVAMGDALAVALLEARGFRSEDFARSHPGGALGRRLLTHVRDVMRTGQDVSWVRPDAGIGTILQEMGRTGLGAVAIVEEDMQLLGIFTDGDLRRLVEKGTPLLTVRAEGVMHPRPHTITPAALAADAAHRMELHRITTLLVVDAQQRLCGALNSNDLMRAKVI